MTTNEVLNTIHKKYAEKIEKTLKDLDALEKHMDITFLIFVGIFGGFAKINFVRGFYENEPSCSVYLNEMPIGPRLKGEQKRYLAKYGTTIYKKLPKAIEVKVKKDRKEREAKQAEAEREKEEKKKKQCDIRKGLKQVAEHLGDD